MSIQTSSAFHHSGFGFIAANPLQNENPLVPAKSKAKAMAISRINTTALTDKTNIMHTNASFFTKSVEPNRTTNLTVAPDFQNDVTVSRNQFKPDVVKLQWIDDSATEHQSQMDVSYADDTEYDSIDWDNIDYGDERDPQAVSNYVDEVYENLRQKEQKYLLTIDYMQYQEEINARMRQILVDWMVEVHLKFKLLPETLHLAVSIMDRFMSKNCIPRDALQLIGVTSMFIACKYEEIYPPECNDFLVISAHIYTKQQVLETETAILNALEFELTIPSSLYFLRRFSKAARSSYSTHVLCKYILEVALAEFKMCQYLPSMVAAAAVYIARLMDFGCADWNVTLAHYTGYDAESLAACIINLLATLRAAQLQSPTRSIVSKYSTSEFDEVALRELPEII